MLGLGALLAEETPAAAAGSRATPHAGSTRPPHFAPKAKRIIHLLMNGGPSHIDTFDPKPLLARYEGQRPAVVDLRTQRKTTGILKSPFKTGQHGESGLWVSELFPHVARHADELCVVRSMHTDIPEHVSGLLMMDIAKPAQHGRLAYLRAGYGKQRSSRLRGALSSRASPSRTDGLGE